MCVLNKFTGGKKKKNVRFLLLEIFKTTSKCIILQRILKLLTSQSIIALQFIQQSILQNALLLQHILQIILKYTYISKYTSTCSCKPHQWVCVTSLKKCGFERNYPQKRLCEISISYISLVASCKVKERNSVWFIRHQIDKSIKGETVNLISSPNCYLTLNYLNESCHFHVNLHYNFWAKTTYT